VEFTAKHRENIRVGIEDQYGEVENFICNTCRYDKKEVSDWVIEGPKKFEKDSVINQNNYTRKLDKVVINTEAQILFGREEDRKKISMTEVPFKKEEN
jgi:NADH-quinone oxidoreductase subunit G